MQIFNVFQFNVSFYLFKHLLKYLFDYFLSPNDRLMIIEMIAWMVDKLNRFVGFIPWSPCDVAEMYNLQVDEFYGYDFILW